QDWQFLGLENQSIRAIAINPENSNEIYVGDGFTGGSLGGIFKTTNAGVSWDTVLHGVFVERIIIRPDNTNIVFASTGLTRIFKTTDGGITWARSDWYGA
ncbi:MAG: hypothetical protein O7D34_03060, partial [Ignavibacteria bacterium]|nr:hypothetical protein [Ignavibacteria bacterium]